MCVSVHVQLCIHVCSLCSCSVSVSFCVYTIAHAHVYICVLSHCECVYPFPFMCRWGCTHVHAFLHHHSECPNVCNPFNQLVVHGYCRRIGMSAQCSIKRCMVMQYKQTRPFPVCNQSILFSLWLLEAPLITHFWLLWANCPHLSGFWESQLCCVHL